MLKENNFIKRKKNHIFLGKGYCMACAILGKSTQNDEKHCSCWHCQNSNRIDWLKVSDDASYLVTAHWEHFIHNLKNLQRRDKEKLVASKLLEHDLSPHNCKWTYSFVWWERKTEVR